MTITDEELAEWESQGLATTGGVIARLIAEVRALRGDFDTEMVAAEEYRQILHKKIEEQRQEIQRLRGVKTHESVPVNMREA